MATLSRREGKLFGLLLCSSGVSIAFLVARIFATDSFRYWFLAWNLILAWVPLIVSWFLVRRLKTGHWATPASIVLSIVWLGFLPNAFYMISDLVHIHQTSEIGILFDITMFMSFIWNGLMLGYISLYAVHEQLRRRLDAVQAYAVASGVLLLCSFAIYLGRYLRWNSWDIVVNPLGLLVDVTDPFVNPSGSPQAFTTTCMFFFLLLSMYVFSYQIVGTLIDTPRKRR